MAGRVAADTAELRRVGTALAFLAGRIDEVLSNAESLSGQYWGAWGYDEFGTQFVEGQGGYRSSTTNIREVLRARADLLRSYAHDLANAADQLDGAEAGNVSRFRH